MLLGDDCINIIDPVVGFSTHADAEEQAQLMDTIADLAERHSLELVQREEPASAAVESESYGWAEVSYLAR